MYCGETPGCFTEFYFLFKEISTFVASVSELCCRLAETSSFFFNCLVLYVFVHISLLAAGGDMKVKARFPFVSSAV